MGRIVMFNQSSVDGYFAALDGSLDWVVSDETVGKEAMESGPGIDTIIFGRRTYEMFASFWPHVLDDSPTSPDPHDPGRRSTTMRAMAVFFSETPKLVFSRTLDEASWSHTRVIGELDAVEIDAMKRRSAKDMIIFGSGSIVTELSRHGLIDEYQIVVSPVLLASGRNLLGELIGPVRLELLGARPFLSGVVMLRYAPAR